MSLYIVSKGVYREESLDSLLSQGEFRRATRNMCVAYLAMKSCIDSLGSDWEIVKNRAGAVLGTSHGELSATLNFLEELGKNQTARPLVFQSSLHNATLGFLAKQFGLMGPTLTVSDKYASGEETISAAEILLSENICDFCFVTGIDLIPESHKDLFYKMYKDGKIPKEGSATVLLCNDRGLASLSPERPRYEMDTTKISTLFRYDSDYVENLAGTF